MVKREMEDIVFNELQPQKVIIIYGARRVGKTVLIEQLMRRYQGKVLLLNGEDMTTVDMLSRRTVSNYQHLFSGIDLLIIDEAQYIENIGKILKLIVDSMKNLAVLVSGSSSFDLLNQAGEPLVGRSYSFILYPFSHKELLHFESQADILRHLDSYLIYGSYPELFKIEDYDKKQHYLLEMISLYLLNDILSIDGIKNASKMQKLLKLIALQIGSGISYDELSKQLGMSRNTVEKYLDLLSKTFVIFKLPAFSTNPRKEISKMAKWYFYDNGIRNALINDFKPIVVRSDVGMLWENFVISERIKMNNNQRLHKNYFFWRNYNKQEIDFIEEYKGELHAFECKWNECNVKIPAAFKDNYPKSSFNIIHNRNFFEFL